LKSDGHSHHLLQWTLSGSMDGETWTVLDRQDMRDLDVTYQTKAFECGESSSHHKFYCFIRLTQTAKKFPAARLSNAGQDRIFRAVESTKKRSPDYP
jgi:hypothetical protein